MITINDFLKTDKIDSPKLLYGLNGTDNIISSVTIEDIPEILDWVTKGEIIISGKLLKQSLTVDWVKRAIKIGVAGIISKEKFISSIDPYILDFCEENNFPIISTSNEYSWSKIIITITDLITEKANTLIKDTVLFQNSLIKLLIKNSSLTNLSESIKNDYDLDFVFLNNNFSLISNHNNSTWIKRLENITESTVMKIPASLNPKNFNTDILMYRNDYLLSEESSLYLFPIIIDNKTNSYVCILFDSCNLKLDDMKISRIQQIILVTTLLIKQEEAFNEELREIHSNIYIKLTNSTDLSIEKAHFILSPLNKKLHTYYYVICINNPLDDFTLYNEINNELKISFIQIDHILHFNNENYYILLIPDIIPEFDNLLDTIYNIYKKIIRSKNIFVGISTVVAINNIAKAQREAMDASRTAYILNNKHIIKYEDLGILQMFINKSSINIEYLTNVYNSYIKPLIDHDEKFNSQLLVTLQQYIKNNCNKIDTANSFYIHKNTLRQRITTINKLLNIDIDSPEDLFNVQLGLKVKLLYDLNVLKKSLN